MDVTDSTRFGPLVTCLAEQAVGAAADRTPHAARAGESVYSCARLLPLCRVLLHGSEAASRAGVAGAVAALVEAAGAEAPRFTDGIGHSREVYHHLGLGLARRAVGGQPQHAGSLRAAAAWSASRFEADTGDVSVALWRAASALPHAGADRVTSVVEAALAGGGEAGSLQRQTPEDSPDHWTFRELAGLHALAVLADALDRPDWRQRAGEVSAFHQGHTQPDYTTYQPWAVAVFAGREETAMFAEQQLHDVEAHLMLHGGGGAVIPALLLTDAAAMLS